MAEAREALNAGAGGDPKRLAAAREEVLIAEGSDWFWWYGDDHSSLNEAEFDDLFRRHLRNAAWPASEAGARRAVREQYFGGRSLRRRRN